MFNRTTFHFRKQRIHCRTHKNTNEFSRHESLLFQPIMRATAARHLRTESQSNANILRIDSRNFRPRAIGNRFLIVSNRFFFVQSTFKPLSPYTLAANNFATLLLNYCIHLFWNHLYHWIIWIIWKYSLHINDLYINREGIFDKLRSCFTETQ